MAIAIETSFSRLVLGFLCSLAYSALIFSFAADTIAPNQHVLDGQAIVSAGDSFELGFFSPNGSDLRYVGIWYREYGRRVVWVANRENPLTDSSGVLMIGSNGNLVLVDGNNRTVWSTEVNVTSTGTTIAVLTDSGNLVLRENQSTNGFELWQSFDHPTDTLMREMRFGVNTRTGEQIVLSSWKSNSDPSQGSFVQSVEATQPPQIFILNGTRKYFRSGQWNGMTTFIAFRFMNRDYINGLTIEADSQRGDLYFRFAPFEVSRIRIIYLDPSGSFEIVDWDANEREWKRSIPKIPDSPCDMYGTCGPFGRCNDDENWSPICRCLRGYEPRDANEWNRGNWTRGCVRKEEFRCERNASVDEEEDFFEEIPNTKLPDFARYLDSANKSSCEALCLNNCSCTAYAFVESIGCLNWENELIDIQNYAAFTQGGEQLYLRLSHSELGKGRQRLKGITIAIIVASAVLGSSLLAFIYWRWRSKFRGCMRGYQNIITGSKWRGSAQGSSAGHPHDFSFSQERSSEVHIFSWKDIEAATNNFGIENKLGEGGFGPVYKGKLSNGQEVAVKRLSRSSGQGIDEFKNEVILISKLQHRNLVSLIGFCIKEEEKLLVYDYMSNKSLDKFIFGAGSDGQTILDWSMRYNIIEGIARGVLYLHRDSRLKIIHRDLKTSNILLDEEMNPKISDFGMARIFVGNQPAANTNRVVGTYGYMAPEYGLHGIFSEKSDVFSFGVVLLEIVSGRRNTGYQYDQEETSLPGHAWQLWKDGKALQLLDSKLEGSCDQSHQVDRCIHIGLLCVQDHENDRPTMATIVSMLSTDMILPIPKRPVFSILQRDFAEVDPNSFSEFTASSQNFISESISSGR